MEKKGGGDLYLPVLNSIKLMGNEQPFGLFKPRRLKTGLRRFERDVVMIVGRRT